MLTGADVTFSWTANDAPVVWWLLYVGTSPGSTNLYYSGYLAPGVTSASVTGIPTDSRAIHVRLRYLLDGKWQSIDYQYTAADLDAGVADSHAGGRYSRARTLIFRGRPTEAR